MSKPKVVIIGVADWAGSAFQACQAINSVGEFECRAISTYTHPYEYPIDILLPLFPQLGGKQLQGEELLMKSIVLPDYPRASQLLKEADIIHLWNTIPVEVAFICNGLPVDYSKLKVTTWTGSVYRKAHKFINDISRQVGLWKTTVQNPCLKFPDEVDSIFIPHAVDTESLKPTKEWENWVGTYRASHGNVPNVSDEIGQITKIVKEFPDWSVQLDYTMSFPERLEKLAKCSVFIQDLNPHVGYWGRSSLEACAFGVPVLQHWTEKAIQHSEGKLGNVPIVQADPESIERKLTAFIEDENYRKEMGRKCRDWVVAHFSYPVIGKMYSDVYRAVL